MRPRPTREQSRAQTRQRLIDAAMRVFAREGYAGASVNRFADLDETHREWWALWAELWLYGQRHPSAAGRLAAVQADSRAAIARALDRAVHPRGPDAAPVPKPPWSGFMPGCSRKTVRR